MTYDLTSLGGNGLWDAADIDFNNQPSIDLSSYRKRLQSSGGDWEALLARPAGGSGDPFTMYLALATSYTSGLKVIYSGGNGGNPTIEATTSHSTVSGTTTISTATMYRDATGTSKTLTQTAYKVTTDSLPAKLYICLRSNGTNLSSMLNSVASEVSDADFFSVDVPGAILCPNFAFGGRTYTTAYGLDGYFLGAWGLETYHDDTTVAKWFAYLKSRFGDN